MTTPLPDSLSPTILSNRTIDLQKKLAPEEIKRLAEICTKEVNERLNPEEKKVFNQVKEKLKEFNPNWDVYHDGTIYRFCKARMFNFSKVTKMLKNDLDFRKENQVDTILETFPQNPYFHQLIQYWPGRLHGFDKEGYTLYFERIATVDAKDFIKKFPEKDILLFHIYLEEVSRLEYEKMILLQGLPKNGGQMYIEDLKGLSMAHLYKPAINLVLKVCSVDEAHYPEMLKKYFVINPPRIFSLFWNILKPVISKDTLEKVEVIGGDFLQVLEKYMDRENIPRYLGGECKHSQGDCIPCAKPLGDHANN